MDIKKLNDQLKKSLKENTEEKPKRKALGINSVLDYIVGTEVDIVDYNLNGDKFTVIYDEGDGPHKKTVTNKQLEEMLAVKDLIWKYDNNGSLDRVSYIREIQESCKSNKNESLAGYKTIAKIIQNDKGFNIAEKDDPMIIQDFPTLKSLLKELAKYL